MRKQTQKIAERPAMQAGDCQHHWLIDPAAGPVSLGVCKHCGRTKEFRNSLSDWAPDLRWQDKSPAPEEELTLELKGQLN